MDRWSVAEPLWVKSEWLGHPGWVATPWDARKDARVNVSPIRYTWSGDFGIGYQTVGDGPVDLIYLPPWGSNLDWNWKWEHHARFLRRLGSFSRLILFDPRGWGTSDRYPPGGGCVP